MGYTVKELSQLYKQSNSMQTAKEITKLIKFIRWAKRLFILYASLFIIIWILTIIK